MLTVAEFYALMGEDISTKPQTEQNYVALQIHVGEEAIRYYTRRYISPMVWEDRFQRPNSITLFETPVIYVDRVIVDGHRLADEEYYFYAPTGRLFHRIDHYGFWPYGNMLWTSINSTPEAMPQYYCNWRGAGAVVVLYKSGYVPTPMVIKQVIADYVYERVLLQRSALSSGGSTPIPVPVGTITQIAIEGVGSVRYADGASTVASNSYRAQRSGEPIIGAAGPLLDAFLEVAIATPGINGLISHRQMVLSGQGSQALRSDNPGDLILYSDDPGDYLLQSSGVSGSQVQTLYPQNQAGLWLWNGVTFNGVTW